MTLKKYLLTILLTTIICWSAFIFVLVSINPLITNGIGFLLFYLSLFFAILSTSAIIGFLLRFVALKQRLVFRLVTDAFRQSFFFSFLIIFSLFLSSKGLFTWLNVILLIFGLSIIEFLLISARK